MGAPGCPELAFWTASMDRARMALASSRRVVIVCAGDLWFAVECRGALKRVEKGARIFHQGAGGGKSLDFWVDQHHRCGTVRVRDGTAPLLLTDRLINESLDAYGCRVANARL